jgi:hypothetical protein
MCAHSNARIDVWLFMLAALNVQENLKPDGMALSAPGKASRGRRVNARSPLRQIVSPSRTILAESRSAAQSTNSEAEADHRMASSASMRCPAGVSRKYSASPQDSVALAKFVTDQQSDCGAVTSRVQSANTIPSPGLSKASADVSSVSQSGKKVRCAYSIFVEQSLCFVFGDTQCLSTIFVGGIAPCLGALLT